MTPDDIDAAGVIAGTAFGASESRAAEVRRYLALQPDGWRVALAGGVPVGTVGAVDYGPFAYIGLLAVDPAAQGRGIGTALMHDLLAWLDERGTPVSLLDATAAGVPIYLRLGFDGAERTDVYQLTGPAAPAARPEGVRVLGPEDAQALAEFDTPIFGAVRARVFSALLAEFPGRTFGIYDETGRLSGYLVAQARRLGPWVAAQPQDAESLLRAALTLPYAAPPMVLVPEANTAAADLMARSGFGVTRFTRHMRRGGA